MTKQIKKKIQKKAKELLQKRLSNKKVMKKNKPVVEVKRDFEPLEYTSIYFNGAKVEQKQDNRKFIDDGEVFFKW